MRTRLDSDDEIKPTLEKRFGKWAVHTGCNGHFIVNCGANEIIEIAKLYGPLAASGVRVILEYKNDVADWVVYREKLGKGAEESQWIEVARWYCQTDWPND